MTDFDQKARTWDADPAKVDRARRVADLIAARVPALAQARVLEVGAGTGLLGFALRDRAGHVTLADASTEMLAVAGEKLRAQGACNVDVVKLDLTADPLPPARYGVVCALILLAIVSTAVLGDGIFGLPLTIALMTVTLVVTLRTSNAGRRALMVGSAVSLLAMAGIVTALLTGNVGLARLAYGVAMLGLAAVTPVVIARRLVSHAVINGKTVKLSDFRGKHLLLDFWGSWCGPCISRFPDLKTIYAKYRARGFEILGMDKENWEGEASAPAVEKARAVILEKALPWPQSRPDSVKSVIDRFRIVPYPTYVLLDPQGKVVSWGAKGQLPLDGPALATTLDKVLTK